MHTLNGVDYWPGAFADDSYNVHMAKRGYAGMKRNTRKGIKSDYYSDLPNLVSPERGNVLT